VKENPAEKEISFIAPIHEKPEVIGDLSYGEGQRAWFVLRLKKALINEFPQLKNRREKFGYKLILHRSWDDLKKAIKEMEKNKEPVPIFLRIGRKNIQGGQ
jgi:hypothetical protein